MTQQTLTQHLKEIKLMDDTALDLFAEQVSRSPGVRAEERSTLYDAIDARRGDLHQARLRTREAMMTHGVIDPSEVG